MSFTKTITTYKNNNLVKHKAQLANERRRQAQNWLRRQAEQKKLPKDAPCFQ
jgi:cell division protein FtsL